MTIYYLYVKTHRITGLNYLGYTAKKDPYKYFGSGTYWLRHLQKHGYLCDTKILHRCISKSAIRSWGLFYSRLWSVVNSKKWANLKEENGDGGGCVGEFNGMYGKTHTDKVKAILSKGASSRFKGKSYEELYGEVRATEIKNKRSVDMTIIRKTLTLSGTGNPRFDSCVYMFYNTRTGEIIESTRFEFYNTIKINKSGVSVMINKGITYDGWRVL